MNCFLLAFHFYVIFLNCHGGVAMFGVGRGGGFENWKGTQHPPSMSSQTPPPAASCFASARHRSKILLSPGGFVSLDPLLSSSSVQHCQVHAEVSL